MNQSSYKLTIQPENSTIIVPPETNILEALTDVDVPIVSACGARGTCGKCLIIVEDGALSPPTKIELSFLTKEQLESGMRLACQAKITQDTIITVPDTSRALEIQMLLGGDSRPVNLAPNVSKHYIELPTQTLVDSVSLFDHLKRTLNFRADLRADLLLLRQLADVLHAWDNKLTAVICGNRLIALEQGDTATRRYGIAFDVGTTTIIGTLVDLNTGEDVEIAPAVNPQSQHGHDVIARITHTVDSGDGLDILQQVVIGAVNQIIGTVCQSANVQSEEIYEMTVVGNSTMLHLLLGLNPRSLGTMPYVPVISHPTEISAADLGININPAANIHALPNIAGFIGADTVGAILAANFDLADDAAVKILADMGTNCELVLRKENQLFACSTAAGPAFEGAKIKHGMYAGSGAIERVYLDDDCHYQVIGNGEPKGICGSGLVDIGAELLRTGIVDTTGRMLPPEELNDDISAKLKERILKTEIIEFVVANTDGNTQITLTQRDIRELQLAKGAIRTGIEVLLRQADLQLDDIDELCVAGGFGNYLNKENAIRLGLIPEIPPERITFIGNAAMAGSKMALISQEVRERSIKIARTTQHLQIADTPDFQMLYMESMMF